MAISGDNRVGGKSGVNAGSPKVKTAPQDPPEAASADTVTVGKGQGQGPKVNRNGGGERSEKVRQKQKPWKAQVRDGNGRSSIHAAGAVGGLAAAVAVSSLQYPDGRWNLDKLADKAMVDNGLPIETPPAALAQVAAITSPATAAQGAGKVQDLRHLRWSAIDNKSTKDVDQIAWAERLPDGSIRMLVAVTDVDALIKRDSPVDKAIHETTNSVYAPNSVRNMLQEKLSNNLISLNQGEDRLATVMEYIINPDGSTRDEKVYQAMVNNHAQLDYPSVGDWLEGKAPPPEKLAADPDMLAQINLQAEANERLESNRLKHGALDFGSNEIEIHCENGVVKELAKAKSQVSNKIVENQMVTANQVMSRFLRAKNHPDRPKHPEGYPTIQRVLEPPTPENWARISEIAKERGYQLPADVKDENAGKALAAMLHAEKEKNPGEFDELSLSVVKLIGKSKFVAVAPGAELPGHFGMGIEDYVQSTAGMRRLGDVINARIMKAALNDEDCPYTMEQLAAEAENLNIKGQQCTKAQRQADKSAIATLLEKRINETFDGVVSGVKGKNTWVKIGQPPVEGHLDGANGLRVGDKVKSAKLVSVNVVEGKIDFRR